jgi:hypothetical protein
MGSGPESTRQEKLLARLDARSVWGWPDRLALVGLGALLAGVVLPWAEPEDVGGRVLGELSLAGPVLVGIAIAAVAVALWSVPSSFNSGCPKAFGLAGGLTAVSSPWVRDRFGDPLPLFGPGRVLVVAGGTALVGAWIGTELAKGTRSRWESVQHRSPSSRHHGSAGVAWALRESRPEPTGAGRVGAAFAVLFAGSVAVAGPWWHGTAGVPRVRSRYANDEQTAWHVSARALRSGIDVMGAEGSVGIALAVLVAAAAVVWWGGRPAAVLVGLAAAFVVGLVAAEAVALPGGRTVVIVAAAVSAGLAVAVASTITWSSMPDRRWAVPLLVLVPVLLGATTTVIARDTPATVPMDGPYRVLAQRPDRADDEWEPTVFDGSAVTASSPSVDHPVWVDGRPGGFGDPLVRADGGVALWVVDDGRVDVRHLVEEPDDLDSLARTDDGPQIAGDLVLFEGSLAPILVSLADGVQRPLPPKIGWAVFGPGGDLWVRKTLAGDPPLGPIHIIPADEIDGAGDSAVEDWPFGPPVEIDAELVAPTGDRQVLLRTHDEVIEVDPDGSSRTVLGGVPDTSCGLNREARASSIRPAPGNSGFGHALAPGSDGSVWVALPSAVAGDRTFRLGQVDDEGTLRLVDHELRGITRILPSPDGRSVLVLDGERRLLELPDAVDRLAELPPVPEGCVTEEPALAPAPALTEVDLPDRSGFGNRLQLDTHGSYLESWPRSSAPTDLGPAVRLHRAGTAGEGVALSDTTQYELGTQVVADGSGGAWWFEAAEPPADPTTVPMEPASFPHQVRVVHLLPDGGVDRTGPTFEARSREELQWLQGDGQLAHAIVGWRHLRVEGARLDVVLDHVDFGITGDAAVTAGGDVVKQSVDRSALVRVTAAGEVPLIGGAATDGPVRSLAVQLDLGTPPDQLRLNAGSGFVADPAGDGVLLAQDGLLVRVALDGTVTPLAQEPRLRGPLTLLDGRLVLERAHDLLVMDVPA